jgi:hypothetical protein
MMTRLTWILAVTACVPILAAAGCASTGPSQGGDPALKGHWAFDEGDGDAAANAAGANPGKVPAGLKWVDGRKGKALLFNGKDYVVVKNYAALNSPQYTFAAWTKLKKTDDHHYIAWKGGPEFPEAKNARRYDLWTDTDGTVNGIVHDEKEGEERFSGGPSVADDRWHHVALTYDGKEITLYIDGKKEGGAAPSAPLARSENDLWIGARPGDVAATGIIDEVRYYDRALTAAEVAVLAK